MNNMTVKKGRIEIKAKAILVGDDLCIIISGGDRPHIGCVTLSIPRPGISDSSKNSATTSVMNITGHKDDEAARYVSQTLASALNKNVVVTCGIHLDNITNEEIDETLVLIKELTDQLIEAFLIEPR